MKRKIVLLIFSLFSAALLLFFFFPRSFASLALPDAEMACLTLVRIRDGQTNEVVLENERLADFLSEADGVRLFRRPWRKAETNNGPDFVGCYLNASAEDGKTVYLFTTSILSVDGVQYGFYGGDFADLVLDLLTEP